MADATVTDQDFEEKVIKSTTPILVDFWAVWCQPCRIQDPILEEVAKDFIGKVTIAKMNVDENPSTPGKFAVLSIPTLIIFKGGNIVKQMIGVQSKETLTAELNKVLSAKG